MGVKAERQSIVDFVAFVCFMCFVDDEVLSI